MYIRFDISSRVYLITLSMLSLLFNRKSSDYRKQQQQQKELKEYNHTAQTLVLILPIAMNTYSNKLRHDDTFHIDNNSNCSNLEWQGLEKTASPYSDKSGYRTNAGADSLPCWDWCLCKVGKFSVQRRYGRCNITVIYLHLRLWSWFVMCNQECTILHWIGRLMHRVNFKASISTPCPKRNYIIQI